MSLTRILSTGQEGATLLADATLIYSLRRHCKQNLKEDTVSFS